MAPCRPQKKARLSLRSRSAALSWGLRHPWSLTTGDPSPHPHLSSCTPYPINHELGLSPGSLSSWKPSQKHPAWLCSSPRCPRGSQQGVTCDTGVSRGKEGPEGPASSPEAAVLWASGEHRAEADRVAVGAVWPQATDTQHGKRAKGSRSEGTTSPLDL